MDNTKTASVEAMTSSEKRNTSFSRCASEDFFHIRDIRWTQERIGQALVRVPTLLCGAQSLNIQAHCTICRASTVINEDKDFGSSRGRLVLFTCALK
eukprot:scaffold1932_cov78-Skeletonema_dohrnii-CCMP3373.AAC.3